METEAEELYFAAVNREYMTKLQYLMCITPSKGRVAELLRSSGDAAWGRSRGVSQEGVERMVSEQFNLHHTAQYQKH